MRGTASDGEKRDADRGDEQRKAQADPALPEEDLPVGLLDRKESS